MSKIDPKDGLTDRYRELCDYKLSGMKDIDAGIKAGFSPKTAASTVCRIFQRPEVKAYLQSRLTKIDNKRVKSIIEVQGWWGDIMDGKVKDVVSTWDEKENKYVDKERHPSLQERIKVSEDIVRSQGGWKDNVDVNVTVDVYEGMELEELIAEAKARGLIDE